jgi:PKD repeat protein
VATITPAIGANNLAPRVVINWGDGNQEDLGVVAVPRSITHTYSSPGTYAVVATATGGGETTTASETVVVAPITVVITSSAASGTTATNFSFTVTPAPGASIQNMQVDFGDGSTVDLGPITGPTVVPKRYNNTGTYTVRATQTNANGTTGTGVVFVTVN